MPSHFYVPKVYCEVTTLINFWNRFRFSQIRAEIELKSPKSEGVLLVEVVDPYKVGKKGSRKTLQHGQG